MQKLWTWDDRGGRIKFQGGVTKSCTNKNKRGWVSEEKRRGQISYDLGSNQFIFSLSCKIWPIISSDLRVTYSINCRTQHLAIFLGGPIPMHQFGREVILSGNVIGYGGRTGRILWPYELAHDIDNPRQMDFLRLYSRWKGYKCYCSSCHCFFVSMIINHTLKYWSDSYRISEAILIAKDTPELMFLHCEETFLSIAIINDFRIGLSLSACYWRVLHHFDVKYAFLHGDLEGEVYMKILLGYESTWGGNGICKLEKVLYGWSNLVVLGLENTEIELSWSYSCFETFMDCTIILDDDNL